MHARYRYLSVFFTVFVASFLNAQEAWLGPPPTAPTTIIPPASAPIAEPVSALAGVYDTTNREEVRTAFNSTWVPSRTATIGWTGNAAGCAEGTISPQWNNAVVTGLNFLRNLAGVPGTVTLDPISNAKAQKAALMFSVNKQINHFPPASWTCYTADGAEAAQKSNICGQSFNPNPGCLEFYMDDFGSTNTAVGHRRWMLYPQTQAFGNGEVPVNGSNSYGHALWVFDGNFGGPRPATRDPYVAWPSPGYFPYQLVPNRWSFSYAGAIFSGATVILTKNGVPVPLTLETVQNGFGEITIVFFATGADPTRLTVPVKPAADTTYTVTVNNVMVSGTPQNITYSVTVFDPAVVSGPPATGCTYGLGAGGQAFGAAGGSGNASIATGPGCVWTVSGIPSWISLTSALSGVADGMFSYQVLTNVGAARSATIMVGNVPFTVEQAAASIPGLNLVGSMAHIAAQENWTTTFTLVNNSAAPSQARFNLFGDPSGPLTLPLMFPQQVASSGALLASVIDRTLAGNASLIVDTGGPQTPPVRIGSAELAAAGSVDGFAIFHHVVSAQEAVVPLETRDASSYLLAFDNTGGVVLAVAVKNLSGLQVTIPVVIRDDTGVLIPGGDIITLQANGHSSFVLPLQYPGTANKRGTVQFNTPAGRRISVLGIRTTPVTPAPPALPFNSFTTIPPLANVGNNGGSIAHIAAGGDGWETTFVLVNTGIGAASATLSFFADITGNPLALPLSFPQSGGGPITMASSVTRVLAAGATLVVQTSGSVNLVTGSAQLTTNGPVSGFVIFRHHGQEAVVPLESRTGANAYILAFDNTAGTATGIAINSVQAATVPVTVRNDAGTTIANDTLNLAANGHLAFTLATEKYSATANIRGTIEIGRPPGVQIGVLAIRIPIAHTFTTIPAIFK